MQCSACGQYVTASDNYCRRCGVEFGTEANVVKPDV